MSAIPAARPLSRRDKQREDMLDDVVSGCSYACLAERHKISGRTARRLHAAVSVMPGLVPGIYVFERSDARNPFTESRV